MIVFCSLLAIAFTTTSVSCESLLPSRPAVPGPNSASRFTKGSLSSVHGDGDAHHKAAHASGPGANLEDAAESAELDDSTQSLHLSAGDLEADADSSSDPNAEIFAKLLNDLRENRNRLNKQRLAEAAGADTVASAKQPLRSKRIVYFPRDRWIGLRSRPEVAANVDGAEADSGLRPKHWKLKHRPLAPPTGPLYWRSALIPKRDNGGHETVPCEVLNRISEWVLRNCGYSHIIKLCDPVSGTSSGELFFH